MNIKIEGFESLMRKMEALGGSIVTAATEGVNKTLQDITTDAKDNAPVDLGQLRDSIQPYGDAHKAKKDEGVISGAAGTDVEHGIFLEFGTGPVGETTPVAGKSPNDVEHVQTGWTYYDEKHEKFVHTSGQPAQPYLWPAYEAHAPELESNIKKAADEQIRGLVK